MKRIWILLSLVLILSGCGAQQTLETVSDVYDVPVSAVTYELSLQLPEEAASFVMEGPDGSKLYQCDGYTVMIRTLEGGDMERTVRTLTGLDKDMLTVIQTLQDGFKCYECAWSSAGEATQQTCRAVILDDGGNHHAVTVMADYTEAGALADEWQHILDSASLVSTG